jgi:hypothetical protein
MTATTDLESGTVTWRCDVCGVTTTPIDESNPPVGWRSDGEPDTTFHFCPCCLVGVPPAPPLDDEEPA